MALLFRVAWFAALVGVSAVPQEAVELRNGDVVLQASQSSRSELIRKASRSKYSHVGVVEVAKDGVFVIEAVQPVSRTPIETWRKRGVGQWVTVIRAKDLDAATARRVVAEAKKELGKPYDARYRWDDEKIYCSELVVKAFARGADRSIGKQETVKSLSLNADELKYAAKLGVSPDQSLVTPGSLAEDESFEVVGDEVTSLAREASPGR
ncbi:MAG: YiiX/YebB-like N1pC/P60 family cysteine hydrolase [Archangium sp.]